jgi:eukaryotic-like serine/threonine-protein kinase
MMLVAAGLGFGLYRATRPAPLKPLVRLDVDLGPDVSLGSVAGTGQIISPDGTRIVYVSQGRLFTRRLDQPNTTELPGTQGASEPFFSPDGQWVAFFSSTSLKKIAVEGGSAIALCDAASPGGGGSWGEDGSIVAALKLGGGLSRIPSAGGPPTPVTDLQSGDISTAGRKSCREARPYCSRLPRRRWPIRPIFGRYLPGGHLVYVSRGTANRVPRHLRLYWFKPPIA